MTWIWSFIFCFLVLEWRVYSIDFWHVWPFTTTFSSFSASSKHSGTYIYPKCVIMWKKECNKFCKSRLFYSHFESLQLLLQGKPFELKTLFPEKIDHYFTIIFGWKRLFKDFWMKELWLKRTLHKLAQFRWFSMKEAFHALFVWQFFLSI